MKITAYCLTDTKFICGYICRANNSDYETFNIPINDSVREYLVNNSGAICTVDKDHLERVMVDLTDVSKPKI